MKAIAQTGVVFAVALLVSSTVFGAAPASQEADKAKVLAQVAQKISGTDVKTTVTVYDNTEDNPCAAEGISYVAVVEVRKNAIEADPETEEPVQVRKWEEFNTFVISKEDLDAGKEISDARCME